MEQGGKKTGGGRPPKNIVQELFCQISVRVKGKGERGSNRVGSVWAWMVWLRRESERKLESEG